LILFSPSNEIDAVAAIGRRTGTEKESVLPTWMNVDPVLRYNVNPVAHKNLPLASKGPRGIGRDFAVVEVSESLAIPSCHSLGLRGHPSNFCPVRLFPSA
jgi:hypothetical protein